MIEKRKDFDECVDAFKKLSLKKKQDIVIDEFIQLFSLFNIIKHKEGLNNNLVYNEEIEDIKNEVSTNDDFAEAIYVYIYSLKEYIAEYINDTL